MKTDKPPVAGNWKKAGEHAQGSWGDPPTGPNEGQKQPREKKMERVHESYGTGKEGADPQGNDPGRTPKDPVG